MKRKYLKAAEEARARLTALMRMHPRLCPISINGVLASYDSISMHLHP
jgi:hypothetical protein